MYWIVGGKPKDGGLNGLESFMPRVAHVFLIGEASDAFAGWLNGKATFTKCGTLENAVTQAAQMATAQKKANAVVLLSPACASYDQFKSYEHRGEEFMRLVTALPASTEKAA
jgi:UDP-N-acetylmuramoylalanine--D-glutamate ligase